jgi:hypothetical protein
MTDLSLIRLIAIDMDGTLLSPERRLTPEAVQAVDRAHRAGLTIALASGRAQLSLRPFALELDIVGPLICSNGAHVLGADGRELAHIPVPTSAREIILDFAVDNGLHLNAYTRDELLFLDDSPWGNEYQRRLRSITPRMASRAEILTIALSKLMLVGEPDQIPWARRELESRLAPNSVRITESEPEYLEFLALDADKSIGLATVAASLGVRPEETAAIGDYLNDVEMLRWVGFSGAMANAHDEVKRIADVIVSSNEEAGVPQFLNMIVDARRA